MFQRKGRRSTPGALVLDHPLQGARVLQSCPSARTGVAILMPWLSIGLGPTCATGSHCVASAHCHPKNVRVAGVDASRVPRRLPVSVDVQREEIDNYICANCTKCRQRCNIAHQYQLLLSYCLDATTGHVVWRVSTGRGPVFATSFLIAAGACI